MVDISEATFHSNIVGDGRTCFQAIDALISQVRTVDLTRPEESSVRMNFDLMVVSKKVCTGHNGEWGDDVCDGSACAVAATRRVPRNICYRSAWGARWSCWRRRCSGCGWWSLWWR